MENRDELILDLLKSGKSVIEISNTLKISQSVVRRVGYKNNFEFKKLEAYTPEEDQFLKENFSLMLIAELAKYLRRTEKSVSARLRVLKVRPFKPKEITIQENEVFVDIENYPNYKISNLGNIISKNKNSLMCHIRGSDGYLYITLSKNGTKTTYSAHRLVALHFIKDTPENYKELHVNHKDGVKTNNNVLNLEWTTAQENITHSIENNLVNYKISDDDVKKICVLLQSNEFNNLLEVYEESKRQGVICSRSYIGKILRGSVRSNISKNYNLEEFKNKVQRLS